MRFFKAILPTVVAMVVSGTVAWGTLYKWSTTANTNATADATINWAEGMAPSQVNDSARAMMAAVAKYRADQSGSLALGGTSTAYTLTTNQVFNSLANMSGNSLCFVPQVANGASATLDVDGLGAKALKSNSSTALPANTFVADQVYCATYQNVASAWFVHGLYAGVLPTGSTMISTSSSCPTGWTKGATHNDKALRLVTGTPSTGGSVAFSTVFAQTTTGSHTLTLSEIPSHDHGGTTGAGSAHSHGAPQLNASGAFGGGGIAGVVGYTGAIDGGQQTGTESAHTHSITAAGGGAGHTHTMDIRTQYVDVVLCTKD